MQRADAQQATPVVAAVATLASRGKANRPSLGRKPPLVCTWRTCDQLSCSSRGAGSNTFAVHQRRTRKRTCSHRVHGVARVARVAVTAVTVAAGECSPCQDRTPCSRPARRSNGYTMTSMTWARRGHRTHRRAGELRKPASHSDASATDRGDAAQAGARGAQVSRRFACYMSEGYHWVESSSGLRLSFHFPSTSVLLFLRRLRFAVRICVASCFFFCPASLVRW